MKTWIFVAALAATGLAGQSALASHGCGPWGNNELRCIGNNGYAHDQTGGLSPRDYTVSITTKPDPKGNYAFSIDVWRSTCGFPGVLVSGGIDGAAGVASHTPTTYTRTEHAGHLQCIEFFVNKCRFSKQAYVPCSDVVNVTINEGK